MDTFRNVTRQSGGKCIKSLIQSTRDGAVVAICRPGDTMVFKLGTQHAVLTVYPEGTPVEKQLALVCGHEFVQKADLGNAVRLTYCKNGAQSATGDIATTAVSRLLPAFRTLYGQLS